MKLNINDKFIIVRISDNPELYHLLFNDIVNGWGIIDEFDDILQAILAYIDYRMSGVGNIDNLSITITKISKEVNDLVENINILSRNNQPQT